MTRRIGFVLAAVLIAAGCSGDPQLGTDGGAAASSGMNQVSTEWVRLYDPNRAANGYTLAFFEEQIPLLIDMNGRIVHAWPKVRARSRLRLTSTGSLLFVALDNSVAEFTWEGKQIWRYELGETVPHHDLLRLENGNTMLLLLEPKAPFDDLREIDADGNTVWEWKGSEHLAAEMNRIGFDGYTHSNSIRELPENPWFDAGDERFRPGNLLLSARDPNLVLIIDRQTKEVVWTYQGDLDAQHEALMLGPHDVAPGRVQIFNNRRNSQNHDRRSELLEIDPRDHSIEWRFGEAGFFSPTHGIGQPLPNGNVMIASSRGVRAFEIDRDGRKVWEWAPPFLIRRPHRYAYDFCPQLASLPTPEENPVHPDADYRFVDREAYQFVRPSHMRGRRFEGGQRRVLRKPKVCRRVFLPVEPLLVVSFGVDQSPTEVRFEVYAETGSGANRTDLFEEVLGAQETRWREERIDLSKWQLEEVRLCVALAPAVSPEVVRRAFWGEPRIGSRAPWQKPIKKADNRPDLTDAEREAQEQHLRAMGYVN